MAVKKFRPVTPAVRHMSIASFEEITKTVPEKSLVVYLKQKSGRNAHGRITVRHRGGGAKRKYRIIDFKQTDKLNIEGIVTAVEYDPYRTAYIVLVRYADGEKRYHLAPLDLKVGDTIVTREKAKVKLGNRMHLKNIPVGYSIHNVELHEGKGGQLGRSAGANIKLTSLEGDYAQIQMPSGEIRIVGKNCYASIGMVGNLDNNNITIGKAGRVRHMNIRPTVRGKAMNPVDHPHGGGEGANSIGLIHPKTPWGMPALGYKTRKRKFTNKMIVKSRHRK